MGPIDPSPDEPGATAFEVDGEHWVAVLRHEMTRLGRGVLAERRLLVYFFGPDGAQRVVVAPNDWSAEASVADIVLLWRAGS